MTIQILFMYLTWIIPLVFIPIFGYKRNPIYFIIGIQLSFYMSHNFYEIYLTLNLYNFDDILAVKLEAIELNRDIVFANHIKSIFITFFYVSIPSFLFWFSTKNKNIVGKQILKEFSHTSLFYFLLFLGSLIDIILGLILTNNYWKMSVTSLILFLLFLLKSISLKYERPKKQNKNTSKLTWFLLVFIIIFYIYIRFFTH